MIELFVVSFIAVIALFIGIVGLSVKECTFDRDLVAECLKTTIQLLIVLAITFFLIHLMIV